MTTTTITKDAPPATLEQKAFIGLGGIAGIPAIRFMLHGQIGAAISEAATPSLAEIQLAIDGAERSQKVYLELIRLLQVGMTREQLVSILQWAAVTAAQMVGEQKVEERSALADQVADESVKRWEQRKRDQQAASERVARDDQVETCRKQADRIVELEKRLAHFEQAEFIAQGAEQREEGAES